MEAGEINKYKVGIIIASIFLVIISGFNISFSKVNEVCPIVKKAAESALFLRKTDIFPLKKKGRLLLLGSGARNTIQGGGGSGGVESDFLITCEQGLEKAGFKIISKKWLDEYPKLKQSQYKNFINVIKDEADEIKAEPSFVSFGAIQPEPEYEIPLNTSEYTSADACIYVVSRTSSEGHDRRFEKGDIYLSNTEIKDIQYLNLQFKIFLVVLNVGGAIDLSPCVKVKNILLLSQLGGVTGQVLADIVTGKVNPSGKLTTSWSPCNIYEFMLDFGYLDETKYKEGVYMGYRYFDSLDYVSTYFAFGHGISYTDFQIYKEKITHKKSEIIIKVEVRNVGKVAGKEVVQVYISPTQNNQGKPYQSLVAFQKTKELKPRENEIVTLKFRLEDIARFDEKKAQFVLDNGKYIIRVGNSSDKTKVFGYISLSDDVVIKQVKNLQGNNTFFEELNPEIKYKEDLNDYQQISLTKKDFHPPIKVNYNYTFTPNEQVKDLPEEELGKICIGKHNEDESRFNSRVFGAAGETVSKKNDEKKYLVLADGPAGIRVVKKYGIDEKGPYRLCENPIQDRLIDYLSAEEFAKIDTLVNNKNRKGEVHYQNATAIPIATALAQTFNLELVEEYGEIIAKDMVKFNIHLWLAPGLNLHRNIQGGRDFEYFSEDPLVAGKMAAAITRGVQKTKNKGVTFKHFICNNQERNRMNVNSMVSERALREIYLRAFEIAIKESSPYAIMTSYNLLNGIHSSQRKDLLIDILRCELGFKGLIMSDWFKTGFLPVKDAAYKQTQNSVENIKGGNNLQMPGYHSEYKLVMEAFKNGNITRDNLLECASYVYNTIDLLNKP